MKTNFLYFLLLFNSNLYANIINDSIKVKPIASQSVELNYNNLTFTNLYKSWQGGYIQYLYKKKNSTIIPRLNIAKRYNIEGVQYELDEYQKFKKKYYVYFNYAFSNSILFAQHRYGIEFYKGFGKANEFSIGVKQLFFSGNNNAMFFTTSLSTYVKNNFLTYRVFIVPKSNSVATSHIFSVRHYLKKEEEFIGISFGLGLAKPEPNYLTVANFSRDPAFFLRSQRIGFSLQKFISKSFIIKPSIEFNRQELTVQLNQFQLLYLFNLSLAKKIN